MNRDRNRKFEVPRLKQGQGVEMTSPLRSMAAVGLAICLLAGCRGASSTVAKTETPFKMPNPMEWGANPDEPRKGEPERIVATWADTVRQTPGEPAERGFGGRLYFYDHGADPIEVDGRLVVYAFDESGRDPTDHRPTRRFVFPPDQLPKNMSVSEIGPSYSVWLPWGTVDAAPTHVSLIARFEPVRGGGLVVSDQARQRLPGNGLAPVGETMIAESTKATTVRQAGFEERTGAKPATVPAQEEEPRKRLTTTTIKLNR
ncbi:hypothetical protein [Botrimarina mediterranea]|uniref:Uncharacterized protein n=1 Tax=Botrimarina mediterranea TaxID=2528022 RepID=A0A518K750_9BACT|nr:hypothetical protein [Botrimarina mediterranea]QDV73632.1 hypothetical protein Spa11_18300 [Botrimarina mediterranea]